VAGLPEENVEYVYWAAPTCAIATPASAYTTTPVALNTAWLWRAEFRIPPGHSGFTGIALIDSGSFIIPFTAAAPGWLIGDDDLLEYPYNKELGTTVQLATYNTGSFPHSWQVRLIYTPMSALETAGDVIVSPDVTDWLAQVEAP